MSNENAARQYADSQPVDEQAREGLYQVTLEFLNQPTPESLEQAVTYRRQLETIREW